MNTEEPMRVVLADDHAPTRRLLKNSLERAGVTVCAEASDAAGAVAAVEEHRPDIALLDVLMPGSGLEAARQISDRFPDTKVVMLTVSQGDEDLFAALQAGAVGYLLKGMDAKRLPAVLESVQRGESALPRTLVSRVVDEFRVRGVARHRPLARRATDRLTKREWEVLELLKEGFTTAQIADRLFVSRVTVRTHVSAILRKLRVPDRAAAIRELR